MGFGYSSIRIQKEAFVSDKMNLHGYGRVVVGLGIRGRMRDRTHREGGPQVGVSNSCECDKSIRAGWVSLILLIENRRTTPDDFRALDTVSSQ